MKFKDKNGNIFIPTNPLTIEQMRTSKNYQEMKEGPQEKDKNKDK